MHLDGINLEMSDKPTQWGSRYKILQRCCLWSGCLSQGQITFGCCVQRGLHKGWTGLAHRRRRRSSKTVNLFPLKRCKQRGRTSPTHSFSLLFFSPNLLFRNVLFVFSFQKSSSTKQNIRCMSFVSWITNARILQQLVWWLRCWWRLVYC